MSEINSTISVTDSEESKAPIIIESIRQGLLTTYMHTRQGPQRQIHGGLKASSRRGHK